MLFHIFLIKTNRVILITKSESLALQHILIKDDEGNRVYDYQSHEVER